MLVVACACERAPAVVAVLAVHDVASGDAGQPREGVLEYVHVDALVGDLPRYTGRSVKVHGTVAPGTVLQRASATGGDYRFELERGGKRLSVHYLGIVPDTFVEGGEVVVTGELADGRLEASAMAVRCPERYGSQPGQP